MNDITPQFFIQVPIKLNGLGLNATDKLVFGAVYTMLNVTSKCFMSNAKIGSDVEMKPNTVAKSLNKLETLQLIVRTRTYKEGSKEIDKRYITLGKNFLSSNPIGIGRESNRVLDNSPKGIGRESKDNRLINKSINRYSSSRDSETSENPYELYQQITGRNLTGTQQPKMMDFIKSDGIELVVSALKTAQYIAKQSDSKANYGLFDSVIHEWEDKGIKTVDQAREYEKQRLHDKQERMNKSKQSYYGHSVVNKEIPKSMKEKYDPEKDKLSDEDKKSIEQELAEFYKRGEEENNETNN